MHAPKLLKSLFKPDVENPLTVFEVDAYWKHRRLMSAKAGACKYQVQVKLRILFLK
jgi:hypothetical protein